MARTQEQRRDETRRRLLAAAAEVFADRGVDNASVDAIADAAERTSGSIYAHFGSKEGLLFELVDAWKNDVAAAASAEVVTAKTLDERLAALWRNFSHPPSDDAGRWLQLEHELWRWATREGNEEVRVRLTARYREAWGALIEALESWRAEGLIDPKVEPEALAPLVTGLLIGLEMQHRINPKVVDESVAVAGLRQLLGASNGKEPR